MAFARDVYTATSSQTDFNISFNYLQESHVVVSVDGVEQTQGSSDDYTIVSSGTVVRFNSGRTSGETVVLQRNSGQSSRITDYTAGPLAEADLDNDSLQAFYMAQEAIDIANIAMGLDTNEEWDAETKPINNVTDPTDAQDAATKNYVDGVALGSFPSPLAVGSGGTGGATAAAARSNLSAQEDVITTQGDVVRGGSGGAAERVALGADNTVLASDGTDAAWETIVSLMNAVFGTTQGTILYQNGTNWVALAVGSAGQSLKTGGAAANPSWGSAPTEDGVQASTSGTSVDFTGIPSWVTRITVTFESVSLSGTDDILVQIGDNGGLETTGYNSASNAAQSTSGYILDVGSGSVSVDGLMVLMLSNPASNTWTAMTSFRAGTAGHGGGGSKSLSATLDRLSIVTTGTDTFDGGNINVYYE